MKTPLPFTVCKMTYQLLLVKQQWYGGIREKDIRKIPQFPFSNTLRLFFLQLLLATATPTTLVICESECAERKGGCWIGHMLWSIFSSVGIFFQPSEAGVSKFYWNRIETRKDRSNIRDRLQLEGFRYCYLKLWILLNGNNPKSNGWQAQHSSYSYSVTLLMWELFIFFLNSLD